MLGGLGASAKGSVAPLFSSPIGRISRIPTTAYSALRWQLEEQISEIGRFMAGEGIDTVTDGASKVLN
jgi:hypothetical protein